MKAVIYARYSSAEQREESIEGQLRECQEYAERHNLTIINTYIDRALSAKSDNRPVFQNMIRDSAKKQFGVVLVWKLDRFARNRFDSATYRAVLKRNSVNVVSAKENISDGPEGIILEAMLEGMAEYYEPESQGYFKYFFLTHPLDDKEPTKTPVLDRLFAIAPHPVLQNCSVIVNPCLIPSLQV